MLTELKGLQWVLNYLVKPVRGKRIILPGEVCFHWKLYLEIVKFLHSDKIKPKDFRVIRQFSSESLFQAEKIWFFTWASGAITPKKSVWDSHWDVSLASQSSIQRIWEYPRTNERKWALLLTPHMFLWQQSLVSLRGSLSAPLQSTSKKIIFSLLYRNFSVLGGPI